MELELTEMLEQFHGPALWVSHDRGEVFRNCKKVCILEKGRSQGVFTLDELFHAPGTEAAARLSGCKNYADAIPQGTSVYLPQWGLTLDCQRPVAPEVRRIGLRAHHIHPDPNGFECRVLRVIEDVFSTIVLLLPVGSAADAPPLRMELDKAAWQAVPDHSILSVSIEPNHILLLQQEGGQI